MRAKDFLTDSIEIIIENSSADEVIPHLKSLGFQVIKKTGTTIKVVVPAAHRFTVVKDIVKTLPGSVASADGKVVQFDGVNIQVKPLEAQGGRLEKEEGQRNTIDASIKKAMNGAPEIVLTVGKRKVKAAGALAAHPGVKADIVIVDAAGNETAWVSLKDGAGPRGFQGWGGVTHQPIVNHEEVQEFANSLIMTFGKEGLSGGSFGRAIQDPILKNWCVFGKEYGNNPGQSNVDLVLQGHPRVHPTKGGFELTGDKHWMNGEMPSDGYEPILMADYRTDRSNFGVPNCRVSVYPKGGRPFTEI